MDRRALLGSLALGALGVPHFAAAQLTRKVYRIGILSTSSPTSDMVGPQPRSPTTSALLGGLHELGYVYGEHFVTEPRGGEGKPERFPALAAELVRLQVDVIVSAGPPAMLAAVKQATSTIPVVTTGSGDPVRSGVAQSLARPGGNITGLSLQIPETTGKRLELLRELVPRAVLVAVLRDPREGPALAWQEAEAAARALGRKLLSLEIRDAGEIEVAFRTATAARAGALLVFAGGIPDARAPRITQLAAASRLPAMYSFRFYVEAGGLMSYGADLIANNRRAAAFVDKILKGAKPADLPFEQPTKFELAINLKAAKLLGLTIPQSLLLRADQVIQ
jgi:putative tryptophan/tyrosine transport system substrate-binding protein